MAAYAALVSLKNTIDDLHHHPRPPVSLSNKQVASLTSKLAFLQEFLKVYNTHLDYTTEADPLEIRIADAAYAAQDAIETQIVDTITKKMRSKIWYPPLEFVDSANTKKMSSSALYRSLKKVIKEMASIEKVAMEIKESSGVKYQRQMKSTPLSDFSTSSSSSDPQKKSVMVGADDLLLDLKDKLTSNAHDRLIVPIVGMGGSGKTSLALNIYQDALIKEHFDIRAWATISQEYRIRQILIDILRQLIKDQFNQNLSDQFNQDLSEEELGEKLYKHLCGRRYLIILDDMWKIDAWDIVRSFFPNNNNGSRIIVTTRISNLSSMLSTSYNSLSMSLLDEAHSWELLSKSVFGEKVCPSGLEEVGKKVAKGCKGLPLSIVVIGGFLAKSKQTKEIWEYIHENLSSTVNLEDDERCLRILYMSYKQLPVHLKPCFLYMGVFPEDEVIRVSRLVRFWVAEGFIKTESGKSLEEIAKEYLEEIVDRNLVMIDKMGLRGNMKDCKIHDSLRDLCLREARKQRFYCVLSEITTSKASLHVQRRIVVPKTISNEEAVQMYWSMGRPSSLFCYPQYHDEIPLHRFNLMLLRILEAYIFSEESMHQMFNSRLLSFSYLSLWGKGAISSSLSPIWNLQKLSVSHGFVSAPSDFWYMSHIRHVRCRIGIHLLDPPDDGAVLVNLQTMRNVRNWNLSKQVVKRIPNIKKLVMDFHERRYDDDSFCLTNLDCLHKLESFTCHISAQMHPSEPLPRLINFPHSLRKLCLYISFSPCAEEILEKIGVLPHLQKLRLLGAAFKEREWTTTQGRFPSLKYLHLENCSGLKVWTSESSHFPCLEHLHLGWIRELEIPIDFAEIATLKVIELSYCKAIVIRSAKRILEEQE